MKLVVFISAIVVAMADKKGVFTVPLTAVQGMGPGPVTGSGTSAGGYYFFQDFLAGTYYIRKGDVFTEDDEKKAPKSLDPDYYEGPAIFYAYYDKDDKKIHAINYLTKTVQIVEPNDSFASTGLIYPSIESILPFTVDQIREEEEAKDSPHDNSEKSE